MNRLSTRQLNNRGERPEIGTVAGFEALLLFLNINKNKKQKRKMEEGEDEV